MIDFIKVRLNKGDIARIFDKQYEESFHTIEEKSAQTSYPIKVVYKGYDIHHYKTVSYLMLSVHKYWNQLNARLTSNFDDFPFVNVRDAITALCNDLAIDPQHSEIVNLEFGVNMRIEESPTEFIKYKTHGHLKKHHGNRNDYYGAGYSLHFSHAQYIIKLYDKGVQHGLDYFLLRYEIRITKSASIRSMGLTNLSDLMVKESFSALGSLLFQRFEEILILDSYQGKASPSYWDSRDKLVSSATIWREWKRFLEEVELKNLLQTKTNIKRLIQNKWKDLQEYEMILP